MPRGVIILLKYKRHQHRECLNESRNEANEENKSVSWDREHNESCERSRRLRLDLCLQRWLWQNRNGVISLTHSFPMHPFSTPWFFQGLEKGCIGNKWVNLFRMRASRYSIYARFSDSQNNCYTNSGGSRNFKGQVTFLNNGHKSHQSVLCISNASRVIIIVKNSFLKWGVTCIIFWIKKNTQKGSHTFWIH